MSTSGLGHFADRNTIRFDLVYPHPPSAVWRAITETEALAVWFLPWELDLRLGGTVLIFEEGDGSRDKDAGPPATGTITALVPESLLEISFDQDGRRPWPAGFVRFELSAHPDGCRLVFSQTVAPDHVWFEPEGQVGGPGTIHPGACAGWEGMVRENLERFLDGRRAPISDPSDKEVWAERSEHYRKLALAELAHRDD
jgi:uncharacterized protein YndB with AHSA1/START domain